ncbi:hypothetical protein [Hyphomonas sp.]|uniref:hypothetical protein n=1 Tax=Hyphomonas sp. TaxID=87 RepID=UPI003918A66C
MKKRRTKAMTFMLAAAGALGVSACTHADWEGIAMGLNMVAAETAVTLTQVPPYGCGFNANRDPVCDDTGDGFADRYADPAWDYIPGYSYGNAPLIRVNDYGEVFRYYGNCDCWRREPSLDTYPK